MAFSGSRKKARNLLNRQFGKKHVITRAFPNEVTYIYTRRAGGCTQKQIIEVPVRRRTADVFD